VNAPRPDRRRRRGADRRLRPERRSGVDRRTSSGALLRLEVDRRSARERRGVDDRRQGGQTAGDQIRTAMDLLRDLNAAVLNEEDRRLLDRALFRLRFALDRLAAER
jgi:hypothetical protein